MLTRLQEVEWCIKVGTGVCAERNVVDTVAIAWVCGVRGGQKGWVGGVNRSEGSEWMCQIDGLDHGNLYENKITQHRDNPPRH